MKELVRAPQVPCDVITPEQARTYAESLQWGPEERVVLPKSGFPVRLRRPTRIYFALRQSRWPADFRAKVEAIAQGNLAVDLSEAEIVFYNHEQDALIWNAFVAPKPSLDPGFDQFDPRWLPDEDRNFLKDYLRGQVLANGQRLDAFRGGESGSAEDGGHDGADVRNAAEPAFESAAGRVAD